MRVSAQNIELFQQLKQSYDSFLSNELLSDERLFAAIKSDNKKEYKLHDFQPYECVLRGINENESKVLLKIANQTEVEKHSGFNKQNSTPEKKEFDKRYYKIGKDWYIILNEEEKKALQGQIPNLELPSTHVKKELGNDIDALGKLKVGDEVTVNLMNFRSKFEQFVSKNHSDNLIKLLNEQKTSEKLIENLRSEIKQTITFSNATDLDQLINNALKNSHQEFSTLATDISEKGGGVNFFNASNNSQHALKDRLLVLQSNIFVNIKNSKEAIEGKLLDGIKLKLSKMGCDITKEQIKGYLNDNKDIKEKFNMLVKGVMDNGSPDSFKDWKDLSKLEAFKDLCKIIANVFLKEGNEYIRNVGNESKTFAEMIRKQKETQESGVSQRNSK